jgi:hypothetical protein
MSTCEKFNKELLLKHRDLIKENVPKQLYLEMNILSYYSLINDLDLYFKSFKYVFAQLINGITPEEFMSDVFPWIVDNCPKRNIVEYTDDIKVSEGDVLFYTQDSGFLKNRMMNIVVTDVPNKMGIDWKCDKEVYWGDYNKIAMLTPTDANYYDTDESNALEQWKSWEENQGKDWYKEFLKGN